jgi:heme exporter protein B
VAALYGLEGATLLVLGGSLLLGTLVVGFIAAIGAALTLDMRGGGGLLMLLVLPLCVPVLIFGTGVVQATEAGVSTSGHWSLLGALFILTVMGAPMVTAAALRLALE